MILGLTGLILIIWLYLTLCHHGFWQRREFLPKAGVNKPQNWPAVTSLTPARNEAALIAESLGSVSGQSYRGTFLSVLIDDSSQDGTASIAQDAAIALDRTNHIDIIQAQDLPTGWSGKIWALQAGLDHIERTNERPDYYWLSDADIHHDSQTLSRLAAWAEHEDIALVSLMVTLNCNSFWEKHIIPAFIYFFQMLYPFASVNNPAHKLGGAAGGCILIRRDALEAIGGFHAIKDKLIDDCELGKAVKNKGYRIWLGHGTDSLSLRGASGLSDLWKMVTRTAFVQLDYSYIRVLLAILGMVLIYGIPVAATFIGLLSGEWAYAILGAITWGLMTLTYFPTAKAYKRSLWEALLIPFTACLFMGMTLQSAWLHFKGSHSGWHERIYSDISKKSKPN